jgi:predicted dehydrogenase
MVAQATDLDLVDICLPTRFHPDAAIAALGSGRHVLSEKPLALNLADCDRILKSAQQKKRQLFVGHVLPFFPEYDWAIQQINSGEHGKLLGGNFKRVISDPTWLKNFYDPDFIGGPLLDLHVHDAHLIRLLFGQPTGVTSRGRMRGETVEYAATLFDFENKSLVVSSTMGVIHQQGRPFTHGFEIHLEGATLHFEAASFADSAELMPIKMLTADGRVIRPTLSGSDPLDGFVAELTEVRDCTIGDRPSKILSGELARDAVQLCEMQTEAIRKQLA